MDSVTVWRSEDCTRSQLERHAFAGLVVDSSSMSSTVLDSCFDNPSAVRFTESELKCSVYGLRLRDEETILGMLHLVHASLGASSFVLCEAEVAELSDVVDAVLGGEIRFPRVIAATLPATLRLVPRREIGRRPFLACATAKSGTRASAGSP